MLGKYDLPADIFSFGIVLTEALAATEAQCIIEETRTRQFGLSRSGTHALLTEASPPVCYRLVDLAVSCCSMIPAERPGADELCRTVEALATDPPLFNLPNEEKQSRTSHTMVTEATAATDGVASRRPSSGSGSGRGGSVKQAWNVHIREMIHLSARVRDGSEFATL